MILLTLWIYGAFLVGVMVGVMLFAILSSNRRAGEPHEGEQRAPQQADRAPPFHHQQTS